MAPSPLEASAAIGSAAQALTASSRECKASSRSMLQNSLSKGSIEIDQFRQSSRALVG